MTKIAGFAWMLLASVLATNATAEPTVSSTSNGIPGIEIANSGSIPENTAAHLRSDPIGDLLPYAVVVRNTGSLSITGLVIRYEISVNGHEDLLVRSYLSPRNVPIPDAPPIIAPGSSIIIVPSVDIIVPSVDPNIANVRTPSEKGQPMITNSGFSIKGPDGLRMEAHTAGFLNSTDRVTIEVDSVIRSDGTIVGSDRSLWFDEFQREISDYTEFRNHLLQLFAEGATVADISAWLQQTAHQQVVRQPNEAPPLGIPPPVNANAQLYLRFMQNLGLQYAWDRLKAATPEKEFGWFYKVHQAVNQ